MNAQFNPPNWLRKFARMESLIRRNQPNANLMSTPIPLSKSAATFLSDHAETISRVLHEAATQYDRDAATEADPRLSLQFKRQAAEARALSLHITTTEFK